MELKLILQKLASLCCVALRELDGSLLSRLKLLLSDSSPVFESLLQEAALSTLSVLVHKYAFLGACELN